MPNGSYVRQDSTLERYGDAKPILDAEYLAETYPKTYRYDVKLMPITKWLIMISIKCMIWPPPSPPPIPYWPCNMVLTEHRQTKCETSHSPQLHHNGGKQEKPVARKSPRRRHNVPATHLESPEHMHKKDGASPPISHLDVRQMCCKNPSPVPGLPRHRDATKLKGPPQNLSDITPCQVNVT